MKKRSILILSVVTLVFASCGKQGGKSGLLVPKDAALVVHINSSSLSSKLSWNEIKASAWFKKMQENSEPDDSLGQQLLNDPSNSGIDTKKDFVMFVRNHGAGSYMVVEGSLTNQATYEQMLAEIHKQQPKEIKKDGDFSYIVSDENSVVLWNKTMFAMIRNSNFKGMSGMVKGMRHDMSSDGYQFEADSLRIFGEQALTLEGSQNLDSDSRFADLVKNGSDVHMWLNLSNYMKTGMGSAMLNMSKAKTLLEDNITATSFNFDNGKISAHTKHYLSDQMAKIYSNNKPGNVSADEINRIPATDLLGVLVYNFSPTGLKEILTATGMDAMADMFLSKMNFSLDELVKASKGEVLVAVGDPSLKMDSAHNKMMDMAGKPEVKFLVATSVNDKASFEKMVTLIWDLAKQKTPGSDNKSDISYKVENNWFALSNSSDYTDQYLAGKSNNKFPFTDKITGHPVALYIDLQKIMKFAGTAHTDSTSQAMLNASLGMWQDVTVTGGDYKDKSTEFNFEINLVDKNTNSLKQLNQYLDKVAVPMMNKEKSMKAAAMDGMEMHPPAEGK